MYEIQTRKTNYPEGMTIVQVTSTLWYQKARKTYRCGICGRIINKGEYYYRYKSCCKNYGWIVPIKRIYCKSCGDKEKERQVHLAKKTPSIILKLVLLYFLGCLIAYVVLEPSCKGSTPILGALITLPLMFLALLFKVL